MRHFLPAAAAVAACTLSACSEPVAPDNSVATPHPAPVESRESSLTVDAAGAPVFRAGLWLRTETRDGETTTYRECRAGGADENLQELLAGRRPGCRTSRSGDRGGLQLAIRCDVAGGEVETVIRIRGGDTAYVAEMDTTLTRGGRVEARDHSVVDARRVSDCPAGMQPGDEEEVLP